MRTLLLIALFSLLTSCTFFTTTHTNEFKVVRIEGTERGSQWYTVEAVKNTDCTFRFKSSERFAIGDVLELTIKQSL
jgi:hypothetical protein